MTIPAEYLPLTYSSGYLFPFTWPVLDTDHIVVTFTSASGVETVLVEGTHYEITTWVRSGDTGNVRRHVSGGGADLPLGTGETIVLSRDVPYTQPTDLVNETQFFQDRIEQGLDRTVMQVQQLAEQVSSTILQLPSPEADTVLGWNDAETALENKSLDSLFTGVAVGSWVADTFTGDGTTVAFSLRRSPGAIANLDVSVSGVTKIPTTDYTLSGQVVTFVSPPASLSTILVRYGSAIQQGSTAFVQELQVATASQTVFDLTGEYVPGGNTMAVYQNGIRLAPGIDFTETDETTVTLITPALVGDGLLFVYGAEQNNNVVTTANMADGSVTQPKLATNAVTTDKITDLNVTTTKIEASAVTLAKMGIGTSAITVNGATTATLNRLHYILDNGGLSDYTITLPAASTAGSLLWFNVGSSAAATKNYTLDGAGSETIDGVTTVVLRYGDSILLISDGSNWRSLAKEIHVLPDLVAGDTKLTGSGNYTAVVGATYRATLVGGGGGGGSGACGSATANENGGQGGLNSEATVVLTAASASLAYSCGSGGSGGSAVGSTPTSGRYGSNGGDTTFDTFTVRGGQGGQGGLDLAMNEHSATNGQGIGGAAAAGSAGASGSNATADWGGGGGGGAGNASGSNSGAGGNGAAGYILIRRIS